MQPQKLAELIEKVQSGQSTEQEELDLLEQLDLSYDALLKYVDRIKSQSLPEEPKV